MHNVFEPTGQVLKNKPESISTSSQIPSTKVNYRKNFFHNVENNAEQKSTQTFALPTAIHR